MSSTPHRKKRIVPSLNTFCSVLPSHNPILSEEVFGVSENSITFPDSKLENTSTYKFNHVFNGFRELQNAFEKVYSPMIRTVNSGENVMLVFGGLPITESMDFFTSMNGRIGIINQAAQLLLRTNTASSINNSTTVTLSWYKIDNTGAETITDLLRMSSSLHSSTDKPAEKSSNLVLRELGKGRGMIVPGLWEVEVTKPQDVDAVIAHVQRMIPAAKHDGKSHSVFQLAVTPNHSHEDENKRAKLKEDSTEIGRLTFVLLSNVSTTPPADAGQQLQHMQLCPWVTQLEEILQWIDSKRPSPPFHKSRVLLLLRDALCTRMLCGVSLFLQPTLDALSENTIWLQLLAHLSATSAERSSAVSTLPIHSSVAVGPMLAAASQGTSMTKEQALLHHATSSRPLHSTAAATTPTVARSNFRGGGSTAATSPKSGSRSILKSGAAQPQSQPRNGKQLQHPQSSHDEFALHRNRGHDMMSGPVDDPYGDEDVHARDFDRQSQRRGGPPPSPSAEALRQQQLEQHQLRYQRQFYEQQQQQQQLLSPPPPPPSVHSNHMAQQQQHLQHHQQQQQQQQHMYDNSLLPPQVHDSGGYPGNRHHYQQQQQQQQQDNEENIRPRENKARRSSSSSSSSEEEEEDRKEAETVRALLLSLQSSRDEVESLQASLLLCQQSLDFHKTEHELLRQGKDKAGQTLKAKDRDRLRKALQELRDYEVYKEVMEAAMSRMQTEIDKLEADSNHHKQLSGHLDKELRKSKNIASKITRETTDFEKSKVALHERVSTAEKEARRLGREREAAVLALSQFKAEKARDEEDLRSSRRVKHKEVLEVKKRLADVQAQLAMQSEEADTAAQLHAQEMKKLQTAHKKSLEMLMACQEENDLLRAAVAELEADAATAAAKDVSAAQSLESVTVFSPPAEEGTSGLSDED